LDEFGLINANARLYDPWLGQFISPDPLADQYPGLSPYSYCLNNPINYVDISGMGPEPNEGSGTVDGGELPAVNVNWIGGLFYYDYSYLFNNPSLFSSTFSRLHGLALATRGSGSGGSNGNSGNKIRGSMSEGYILPVIDVNGHLRLNDGSYLLAAVNVDGEKGFDIDKAVEELNNNAGSKSLGACGRYIRYALEAGLRLNRDNLRGLTPLAARSYGDYLRSRGYVPVKHYDYPNSTVYYNPVKGDIAVIQGHLEGAKDNNGIPYGHIQMYNGSIWISDFRQNRFWPGYKYREHTPAFIIYRWGFYP
jgi:hypothetical protein